MKITGDLALLVPLLCLLDGTGATPLAQLLRRQDACDGGVDGSASYDLGAQHWQDAKVDQNLQAFLNGGQDTDGVTWTGVVNTDSKSIVHELGAELDENPDWSFSISNPDLNLLHDCGEIGNRYQGNGPAIGDGSGYHSTWGYHATYAVKHLATTFNVLWTAITPAEANSIGEEGSIAAFAKPDYSAGIPIRQFFAILGIALGIGSLVPFATAAESAALGGLAAGSAATVFGSLSAEVAILEPTTQSTAPDKFGQFVVDLSNQMRDNLENYANDVFGQNSDELVNLLANGAYATASSTTPSSGDVINAFSKAMYGSGINQIWDQSKIWITYALLNDTSGSTANCDNDKNGPQNAKYCNDGGVYYLYRYNEDGAFQGELAQPWGYSELANPPYNLDPISVLRSSVSGYRQQTQSSGNFTYSTDAGLVALQDQIRSGSIPTDLQDVAGTWTLPVCDMGYHSEWNYDYTQSNPSTYQMPCACGPGGSYTAAFVKAAHMDDFQTLPCNCWAGYSKDLWWGLSEGSTATQIDYGNGNVLKQGGDDPGYCPASQPTICDNCN